jgi:hypothetical protein
MSTQLLEPSIHPDEITAEAAVIPAGAKAPSEPTFDRPTTLRIVLGEELAETLDGLVETNAWDRLDPAIGAHLLAQAERLRENVARLQDERPVRRCETVALRLRRLERRLGVSVEHLGEVDAKKRTRAGFFLGDFTEPEAEGAPRRARQEGSPEAAPKAKKGRRAAAAEAVRGFKTRAERLAAHAMQRRVAMYAGIGAIVACVAMGWNLMETVQVRQAGSRPPSTGIQPMVYFKEMQAFMPVVQTSERDRMLFVVVSKDWLLRSYDQRKRDAESAHVWLMNRNVPKLMIAFDDGMGVAKFDNGVGQWFDPSTMAKGGKVAATP